MLDSETTSLFSVNAQYNLSSSIHICSDNKHNTIQNTVYKGITVYLEDRKTWF